MDEAEKQQLRGLFIRLQVKEPKEGIEGRKELNEGRHQRKESMEGIKGR
jgi:hypothetical protein